MLDYRARMYDPAIGRFVSADSVVPDYANPQDLNRYSYVRNAPLNYVDPSGHYLIEDEPDDPFIWYRDKPEGYEQTLIRGANWDSFVMWEETQAPKIVPDLYIEGVSGRWEYVKGGYEKVYDFSTNEVGYFGYSGGQLGTDIAGGDVGGYVGFGWKGDLRRKSLAEAYKDAFYTIGGGANLPFDLLSAGCDFSVSGDGRFYDNGASLTQPLFENVKTLTFGGGAGISVSPFLNGHIAATNYTYFGGTPHMSDPQMIGYIWLNEWRHPGKALLLSGLTIAQ